MGKSSTTMEVYNNTGLHEEPVTQRNNLISNLKELKEKKQNRKASRSKENIKIKSEINEIEVTKTVQKSVKAKSGSRNKNRQPP